MGRHLLQCAAGVDVDNPRLKVALLCFAESGNDTTRVALPGFGELRKWLGVEKQQVYNLINRLVELQLVARHKPAYRGHRAEFLVFPNGCCELHGKRPAEVDPTGGDVVTIGSTHHVEQVDSFSSSTASADHARPVDPLAAERVHSDDGKGPIDVEKGSTLTPRMGPLPERESGRLQVLPPRTPPTEPPSTGGHLDQPLTSRDPSAVDLDFSRVDEPARGVRVAPPNGGRALGCRHCDAGWICDLDGLPLERCPHCHPAQRGATG